LFLFLLQTGPSLLDRTGGSLWRFWFPAGWHPSFLDWSPTWPTSWP
jgi:hypothetical protein